MRRPPLALRALLAPLALLALAMTVALMLSDRAPGVLSDLFGDDARRLWARIDASGRADFVTDGERPEPDAVVHIVVWAAVTALVALIVWSWRHLPIVALGVFVGSMAVELAQGRWSSTRAVERSDMMSNALGVALGAVAAALVYGSWAVVAGAVARRPRRSGAS